jgi:hypothetical protein
VAKLLGAALPGEAHPGLLTIQAGRTSPLRHKTSFDRPGAHVRFPPIVLKKSAARSWRGMVMLQARPEGCDRLLLLAPGQYNCRDWWSEFLPNRSERRHQRNLAHLQEYDICGGFRTDRNDIEQTSCGVHRRLRTSSPCDRRQEGQHEREADRREYTGAGPRSGEAVLRRRET